MALIINGERVEDSVIREEARQLRPHYQQVAQDMDPIEAEMQLRDWSRENVIEKTLLRQQALKDETPVDEQEIDAALRELTGQSGGQTACRTSDGDEQLRAEVELRLRIDRLLALVTERVKSPRHKDVAEYYRKHRDEFRHPELVGARHIVKNVDENRDEAEARAAIGEIEARLKAGESFEELADCHSDCPGNGGDLGYFPRGEMVPEFDDVVFSLRPGETSAIFRTTFGFHIAQVYDRKPAGLRSLEEVKEEIGARLLRAKRDAVVEQYLDGLKAGARIEIVPDGERA